MKDPETQTLNFEGVDDLLRDQYPSTILFSSVKTKTSVNKFLIEELKMVPAEKKCISKSLVWKKKKGSLNRQAELREVDHDAYIVPFIDNLKNLMMNDYVRENVNNPIVHENGVYRTVLDGKFYRENGFFCNNPKALAVVLYYDDLGVANPLASSSRTQKLSMFYWTLANIIPELRSSNNAIQLLAIVKTSYLKEAGALQKILEPFINDIKILQAQGIDISIFIIN
ncbi:uncharacterized protein LOC141537101 [Cotesia typhae]|uniref:uncharacterized protein LOC141537101 n=1 Tax=Cotesia typhae TaxID=2053667 RepID=UPI003D6978E1